MRVFEFCQLFIFFWAIDGLLIGQIMVVYVLCFWESIVIGMFFRVQQRLDDDDFGYFIERLELSVL
jgi:hypothetical protein